MRQYWALFLIIIFSCEEVERPIEVKFEVSGKNFIPFVEQIWDKEAKVTDQNDWAPHQVNDSGWVADTLYFDHGGVKKISFYGDFNGCGIQVGTEVQYDSIGNKRSERNYKNFQSNEEAGCHDTKTIIKTTYFRSNGLIEKVEFERTCYECEIWPCGWWKYYGEYGELEDELYWGDCWDESPTF